MNVDFKQTKFMKKEDSMEYILSFLEGIITFISPCLLPMLPIYVSYFAAGKQSERKFSAFINSLGFVLGFTIIFVSLGAFAGTLGNLLKNYETAINIIGGVIVILFGLNFMEIISIPFLSTSKGFQFNREKLKFGSSVLFGIVFSISWTPCVGAFLGSALMLAANRGNSMQGILMLLSFSIGLGIPFILSTILIDRLKVTFDFIKKHYVWINRISGGLLVIVGILMATGMMGYFLSLLTF